MKEKIEELWDNIAEFESRVENSDSENPLLGNARKGARMEAYIRLFDDYLDELIS